MPLVDSYTVLQANGGEAAIKICKQHSELIDLLITNVVMPKMSGKQVAEQFWCCIRKRKYSRTN